MDQTDEEAQETHACGQRAVASVEDGDTKQKPAEKRKEPARQEAEETPNSKQNGQSKRKADAPTNTGKKRARKMWSREEKDAVWRACGDYIRRGEVPGISVCTRAISAEPALFDRSWLAVKFCCHNIIASERRRAM